MTLTELRYVVTLARERHFGRAAERCHVSQPTLSVAVRKLEEELGIPLFERSKSNIRVTESGLRIVEQAQRVLDQVIVIKDMAQDGKNQLSSPL
jgi:LysR family hydrogen peroxide-inducible transcriptional activator